MSTAPASTVAIPASGTYTVDPASSSISFTTKHMFGTGKVAGSFGVTDGTIVIAEPVTASTVSASASAGSFASGNPARDAKVLSAAFLDADNHATVTFTSTRLTQEDGHWILEGNITARGVAAPVQLTVTESVQTPLGLNLRATGQVDRYAHGITKMKGMAGRYLNLDISAVAIRS